MRILLTMDRLGFLIYEPSMLHIAIPVQEGTDLLTMRCLSTLRLIAMVSRYAPFILATARS